MHYIWCQGDFHIPIHMERYSNLIKLINNATKNTIVDFSFIIHIQQLIESGNEINFNSKHQFVNRFLQFSEFVKNQLLNSQISASFSFKWEPITRDLLETAYELCLSHDEIPSDLLSDYQYKDVPIGDLSFIDYSLCNKKNSIDPLEDTTNFRLILLGCVLSILMVERYVYHKLDRCRNADSVRVVLPDEYSGFKVVQYILDRRYPGKTCIASFSQIGNGWRIYTNYSVHVRKLREVNSFASFHKNQIFRSSLNHLYCKIFSKSPVSHAYSPDIGEEFAHSSVRASLEIPHSSKLVTYFTSSPDELVGANLSIKNFPTRLDKQLTQPFTDEYQLVSELIEYCCANQIFLVIRMHPRLGKDHRLSHESQSLKQFMARIQQAQSNLSTEQHQYLRIISPSSKISSYLLGIESSVCAYYWSSIGIELALMGIRTLAGVASYGPIGNRYHSVINKHPSTGTEWFKLLAEALTQDIYIFDDIISEFYSSHYSDVVQEQDDFSTFSESSSYRLTSALLRCSSVPTSKVIIQFNESQISYRQLKTRYFKVLYKLLKDSGVSNDTIQMWAESIPLLK